MPEIKTREVANQTGLVMVTQTAGASKRFIWKNYDNLEATVIALTGGTPAPGPSPGPMPPSIDTKLDKTEFASVSGAWQSSSSTVSANSAYWQSAYQTMSANSANWNIVNSLSSQLTGKLDTIIYASASGNWESTYSTVMANSSQWAVSGGSLDDLMYVSAVVTGLVENINSVSNQLTAKLDTSIYAQTSGGFESSRSTVWTNSANWQNTYTTVINNSALWTAPSGFIPISGTYTIGPVGSNARFQCSGSNDNLVFDTAIATVSAGGILQILPGTYNFSSYISITKEMTLLGSGDSTIIQQQVGYNTWLIEMAATKITIDNIFFKRDVEGYVGCISSNNQHQIIRRCRFWGNAHHGMSIVGSTLTTIEFCIFENNNFDADVVFSNGSSQSTIQNCYFWSNVCIEYYGSVQNGGFVVNNNYIRGSTGIRQQYLGGSPGINGLSITNNIFRTGTTAILLDIQGTDTVPQGVQNVTIFGNTFKSEPNSAGPIILRGATGVTINSNAFGAPDSSYVSKPFISIESSTTSVPLACTNTVISNNTGDASLLAYAVTEANSAQTNTILSDNVFTPGLSGIALLLGSNSIDTTLQARKVALSATNWDSTYSTVSTNSALWSQSASNLTLLSTAFFEFGYNPDGTLSAINIYNNGSKTFLEKARKFAYTSGHITSAVIYDYIWNQTTVQSLSYNSSYDVLLSISKSSVVM